MDGVLEARTWVIAFDNESELDLVAMAKKRIRQKERNDNNDKKQTFERQEKREISWVAF